jgi:hypothetical protein
MSKNIRRKNSREFDVDQYERNERDSQRRSKRSVNRKVKRELDGSTPSNNSNHND